MKKINEEAAALLALDSKVGLVGFLDDDGYPHVTFFNSLQGLGEDKLTLGQFMTGMSKECIPNHPDVAFLALTADMRWVRGNARFTHTATTGPEYDMYNAKPLFRYNTYFAINTVWYFDLQEIGEVEKLPMGKIVAGALLSRAAAPLCKKCEPEAITEFSVELLDKIDGLKFLCYTNAQGMLTLLPVIQATSAGAGRVAFAGAPYGKELAAVPTGQKVAVYAANLKLQSVLTQGVFVGKKGGAYCVDIEKVYNSMPTCVGYIFPRQLRPEPIESF
ncbi:MAG: hypothetical protein LBQ80_05620 [Clostridium sp.]|jgi:hypothetical protein|nr:hypothetical protein [Clostridium sp.]